jgi:hypothetical protein
MIFTGKKRLTKMNETPVANVAIHPPIMTFSARYRHHVAQSIPEPAAKQLDQIAASPVKKMRWGEPTWFLFHTLAEKIKPEYFASIRQEMIEMIRMICMNLPCPICSTHAKTYLAGTNFATIVTKEHLRIFFYNFHNEVNRRKGYAFFPYDQVEAKYSKANTVNIIHHFMMHFEDRNPSNVRMIADSMYRQRIVSLLKTWFSKNVQMFEL